MKTVLKLAASARRRALILCGCAALLVSRMGLAQCDPGPASGGGVNRCYDDGYVYVDVTGNAGGATWNWGYQSASQVPGNGMIVFHKCSMNNNAVVQLTDSYSLNGLAPPAPPYQGTFEGPGFIIPDAPAARVVNTFSTSLSVSNNGSDLALSWTVSPVAFTLQATTNLLQTNAWAAVTNAQAVFGNQIVVTYAKSGVSTFFRLVGRCAP
jgi:hypothetical protein